MNTRGAGRKFKFNENDVKNMLNLLSSGHKISYIAKKYNTARQVIGRYINKKNDSNYTHRIFYMRSHKIMTIIDVDFFRKKIIIQNRTNNIWDKAFGDNETPNWDNFNYFLKEHVFDEGRVDKMNLLKLLSLESYDPISIIQKTNGKIEGDNHWIKIKQIN